MTSQQLSDVGGLSPWLFASQPSSFALDINSQSAAKTKGGSWFPIPHEKLVTVLLLFWPGQHPSCFSSSWGSQLLEAVKKQNTCFAILAQILFSCLKIDPLDFAIVFCYEFQR